MKELLLRYARYNVWANKQFVTALQKIDNEQLDAIVTSSFSSVRKTVYHMWSAEDIWLQRLLLTEQPVWAESVFKGDFAEALAKWQQASADLVAFIEKQYDDTAFEHVLQYYNLKKQSVKLPVYVALMQVLNHATYHRGQLVTMMRQLGVKKIPQTDFFLYAAR